MDNYINVMAPSGNRLRLLHFHLLHLQLLQLLFQPLQTSGWMGVQLETLPAGPVLENSRLTIMCHGPQSQTLGEITISLNGRPVLTMRQGVAARRLDAWTDRPDVVASLAPHFGTVRLLARPADSGVLSCRAAFAGDSNATTLAGERQLIVGLPPEPPVVRLFSQGRQVEWLADKTPFEIRCTGRTVFPSLELVVYVSDISLVGHVVSHEDDSTVVYTRQLTADPELDGLLVMCVSRNVFGSQRDSVKISVRFISEDVVIGESLTEHLGVTGLETSLSRGQRLTCHGASNPLPFANWSVLAGARDYLLGHDGLLEVSADAPIGDYLVACTVHLPTGKVVTKAVRLHVVQVKGPSFAPNIVAILFGVFLAISVLLNTLFIALLCRIYKNDEAWNAQHQYTHIPIRRWVTKSMT